MVIVTQAHTTPTQYCSFENSEYLLTYYMFTERRPNVRHETFSLLSRFETETVSMDKSWRRWIVRQEAFN